MAKKPVVQAPDLTVKPEVLTTPWLLPPVEVLAVLQRFAVNETGRPNFYKVASGGLLLDHEGLDFGGFWGMPVYSAAEGQVEYIRFPGRNGVLATHPYGIHIIVRHEHAGYTWRTQLCHLGTVPFDLKPGMRVHAGQYLGGMGNTGNVVKSNPADPDSGTHLHLMTRLQGATALGYTYYSTPDHGVVKYPNDLVDPAPLIKWPEGFKL